MEETLTELYGVILERKRAMPEDSYTASLLKKGRGGIVKKVAEECMEVVIAALEDKREQVVYEMADLWYHLLVLMANEQVRPEDVTKELRRRFR